MSRQIEVDGENITEAVQILYDIAHSSMDWGSGFLDNDEMETVIRLAVFMGWEVPSLPSNSDAMATVASKFPDHYSVKAREVGGRDLGNGVRTTGYLRHEIHMKQGPTS